MKPIQSSFLVTWVALCCTIVPAADEASVPPSVLLIMTDDQGYGDVRSHGNDRIDTPVLDRLASEGARFDRFFVSPVCSPTRASLLTGRYHLRTGVHGVTRAHETMRTEEVTIAEVFRDAGYATGIFGKWHNGAHYPQHPNGQGFDEFVGFCAGHWNNYFGTELQRNGRPFRTRGYIADVLTDEAIGFLKRNAGRRFLCYLPYNTPHSPFQVPDTFFDKYKARGLDDRLACVYGMCENLDWNVGRLLETLDELGLSRETIVVFLTDNGPNTDRYNAGMKGRKGSVHEGGVRVPLFLRWPGRIRAGTVVERIASHIDILPTLVDLARITLPRDLHLDGVSLVPLLGDGVDEWPERRIFTHQFRGGDVLPAPGSVRTDRWRAANTGRGWELYDMVADPGQEKNVSRDHPDVLRDLGKAYDDWFRDVTRGGFDPIPVEIGHPDGSVVSLPGHEANLRSDAAGISWAGIRSVGISYSGRAGWANDWVTNWTSIEAYPAWPLRIVQSGRYEISLRYVCPEDQVGSTVRVEVAGARLEAEIREAHDPRPIHSPDRVDRGEVYEKVWRALTVGVVELPAGDTDLVVRATRIARERVCDLKAVELRRLPDA